MSTTAHSLGRRLLSIFLAVALLGCQGRPRRNAEDGAVATLRDEHIAELDLRGGAPERASGGWLFGSAQRSFSDLVLRLREMRGNAQVKGVFVRLGGGRLSLAAASEIGHHLALVRKAGLPIICHSNGYTNSTIWLAALGCDETWLSPAGNVDTVGLAAQLLFGRKLLERLDVHVDFIQVGRFKGASEPFTRDSASPEARRSLQTTLASLRTAWVDGVTGARTQTLEELGLEDGPHTPKAALQRRLIDAIGFESEARSQLEKKAGVSDTLSYFGGKRRQGGAVGGLVNILSGGETTQLPHVAIVRASGGITMRASGSPLSGSSGITEYALSRELRSLAKDPSVVAVVLRIDSPGGSALASDLLWHALMKLREQKPLVVSIGSMAASGGYYLASAGTKIVAERTSIIGSIGVVGGKLSFAKSLEHLGVHVETIAAKEGTSSRALYGSPLAPWDDATRAKVGEAIEETYALFLKRIASGRDMAVSAIEPSAEGRLMGGDDALQAGLVDEIGGLDRALELSFSLASVPPTTLVEVSGTPPGLWQLLAANGPGAATQGPQELAQRAREGATRALLDSLLPLHRELEAFTASASPLLQGEHVLVALPYAIAIH